MAAPERTNDAPEQPLTQSGVRIYEGEPDANGDQYVRVVSFAADETEQMLAFYYRVASQVAEWNSEGRTHRYRSPELVERTLTPWGPMTGLDGHRWKD